MTPTELLEQIELRQQSCAALRALWLQIVGKHCPSDSQFAVWLDANTFEAVRQAIAATGRKLHKLAGNMDSLYLLKYCSACMSREQEEIHA